MHPRCGVAPSPSPIRLGRITASESAPAAKPGPTSRSPSTASPSPVARKRDSDRTNSRDSEPARSAFGSRSGSGRHGPPRRSRCPSGCRGHGDMTARPRSAHQGTELQRSRARRPGRAGPGRAGSWARMGSQVPGQAACRRQRNRALRGSPGRAAWAHCGPGSPTRAYRRPSRASPHTRGADRSASAHAGRPAEEARAARRSLSRQTVLTTIRCAAAPSKGAGGGRGLHHSAPARRIPRTAAAAGRRAWRLAHAVCSRRTGPQPAASSCCRSARPRPRAATATARTVHRRRAGVPRARRESKRYTGAKTVPHCGASSQITEKRLITESIISIYADDRGHGFGHTCACRIHVRESRTQDANHGRAHRWPRRRRAWPRSGRPGLGDAEGFQHRFGVDHVTPSQRGPGRFARRAP